MPGVYEGGLKVWEASLDLVEHLVSPKDGSSGASAGGGLFAQDEAEAVTGRRKSVLEVDGPNVQRCLDPCDFVATASACNVCVGGAAHCFGLVSRAVNQQSCDIQDYVCVYNCGLTNVLTVFIDNRLYAIPPTPRPPLPLPRMPRCCRFMDVLARSLAVGMDSRVSWLSNKVFYTSRMG